MDVSHAQAPLVRSSGEVRQEVVEAAVAVAEASVPLAPRFLPCTSLPPFSLLPSFHLVEALQAPWHHQRMAAPCHRRMVISTLWLLTLKLAVRGPCASVELARKPAVAACAGKEERGTSRACHSS